MDRQLGRESNQAAQRTLLLSGHPNEELMQALRQIAEGEKVLGRTNKSTQRPMYRAEINPADSTALPPVGF